MRKIAALAAKVAVSLGLLYLALGRVDLGTLAERLQQIEIGWLLAAIALLGLQVFMIALRWHAIIRQCGASIPISRVFRYALIGGFFNQTLPSTVGGDAARVWLVARDGAGWSKATYSVLIDRVVGLLILALIVVVCTPWSFELIRSPLGRAALVAIGLGCIAGPAVFIALGYWRWKFFERLWLTRHLAAAAAIAKDIFTSRQTGGLVAGLSLVVHALTIVVAWLAARSVAAPFEIVHSLLLLPPVLLIATVPISIAGWGVREGAMVLAFAYAGLPESDGLLVSMLYGIALFTMGAIGGVVWLASPSAMRLGEAGAATGADAQRP